MTKILKQSIIAALCAAGIGAAPASSQVRARPVIAPTGPVKPVINNKLQQLTQEELQARMKPAPRYLAPELLKAQALRTVELAELPDLKAAFSLTPAVQSVSGRGSMKIDGQVYLPNPMPPGFPGQAIIRRGVSGGIGVGSFTGGVFIQLDILKDTFYILDCLGNMRGTGSPIQYTINSGSVAELYAADGHFILTVPKQKENGISRIGFYPENLYSADKKGPELDFWGCQISTGG